MPLSAVDSSRGDRVEGVHRRSFLKVASEWEKELWTLCDYWRAKNMLETEVTRGERYWGKTNSGRNIVAFGVQHRMKNFMGFWHLIAE